MRVFDLIPATQEERDSRMRKCRQIDWTTYAGPGLQDRPRIFSRAHSIEVLADFFKKGGGPAWQGVLFGDLAFVGRCGDDEWLSFKRTEDGNWLSFESMGLGAIAHDQSDFTRRIACMQLATPEECRNLNYLVPQTSLAWEGEAFPGPSEGFVRIVGDDFDFASPPRRRAGSLP